jgi:hypothetical protein
MAILGAATALMPAFMEQPAAGRIGIIVANGFQGPAADPADSAPERGDRSRIQSAASGVRVEAGSPKDFVSHPIAHAGKAVLQEKRGLYGQARVSLHKAGEHVWRERGRSEWGG